ncbi:MAG: phospholipid carrier-dependent glycosyltransferase [Thermomicrobiales bacterium]
MRAGCWWPDNPLGWRIVGVGFGALGAVMAYLLALALTGNRAVSMLAASLLLLLDGLYLVESRVGMSNLFLVVFSLSARSSAFPACATVPARQAGPPLLLTGLCLGLALATKWSAVSLLELISLVVCARTLLLAKHEDPGASSTSTRATGWRPSGAWLRSDWWSCQPGSTLFPYLFPDRA